MNESVGATRVGFVGLGRMGQVLVQRLLDAGFAVHIWNRTAARADPLLARGAQWVERLPALATHCDVVCTMLTDDAAVQAVYDPQQGLLAGDATGTLLIEMSTVRPATVQAVAEQAAAHGALLVDAPLSGSLKPAQEGRLLGLAGGPDAAVERARPVLAAFCRRVAHVGPSGAGSLMKLVLNLPRDVYWQALGEALAMGERAGLERAPMLELIADSPAALGVLAEKLPALLEQTSEAPFDIQGVQRNLHTMLATGNRLGVPLPSASSAVLAYTQATAAGWGARDVVQLVPFLIAGARATSDAPGLSLHNPHPLPTLPDTPVRTVGFVGLGRMGQVLVQRLLDAGFAVHIWNRTAARADPLLARGAQWAESLPALATHCDVVCTIVTDDAAVQAVYDGHSGLLAGDVTGTLLIEMSTVRPATVQAVAVHAAAHGALLVDAPLSGTLKPAQEGRLLGLAGGPDAAVERARPVLAAFCRRVAHVGPSGAGSLMKLVLNLPMAVYWQALAEALAMGQQGGLELQPMLEVIADSPASIGTLAFKLRDVVEPSEHVDFDVTGVRKDLLAMATTGALLQVPMPATQVALLGFASSTRAGYGAHDLTHHIHAYLDMVQTTQT